MISVVIPVRDGVETLEPLLEALRRQRVEGGLEILIALSPSRDRSGEIARAHGARVIAIPAGEFDHGDSRNAAALEARGEILVFLTQDVLPADDELLQHLVEPLRDPAVWGVSGRMVPCAGASAATRRGLRNEISGSDHPRRVRLENPAAYRSMHSSQRRELYIYSNVCGAIPRALWRRLPFPRARFGEDLKWARLALECGGILAYEPRARVFHSHEPRPLAAFARARKDARLLKEELGRPPMRSLREAWCWARREAREDAKYHRIFGGCTLRGSRLRRSCEALGAWLGGRGGEAAGEPARAIPTPLPGRRLRILHVIHGFPPESSAGTEVACLALARAQREAGHEVCVFTRSPDPAHSEFSLWRDEVQGLAVYRIAHHLEHRGGIQDTFQQAEIERGFQEVLQAFSPDLVHFQHLIHLSVTLVPLAARSGAATVASLHDYWPVCPRVQMLRPDGRRCRAPQRLGCYLCVKRRWLPIIAVVRRFSGLLERSAQRWVSRLPLRSRRRIASDLKALYRRQRTLRRTYRRIDLVLAPSRHLARVLAAAWRWPRRRIVVLENGLEKPQRMIACTPRVRAEAALQVAFLGSIVEHKGVHLLVRAARRFARADLQVQIHGHFDPDRDAYHARLLADGRSSPVVFHGAYENRDLPALLAGVDLVALPSLWAENSPVTLLECAAAGVPVLVPRLGGFLEKIHPGVEGWFFRPGSVRSLRRHLVRLVRSARRGEYPGRREPDLRDAVAQARELEIHYRSALLKRRTHPLRVLFERWGRDAQEVLGVHEVQGRDYLLLRPERGGACMYHWHYPRSLREDLERFEPAELEVELMFFAGERMVPLGATIYFNGGACGEIRPAHAGERDESRAFRFPIRLNGGENSIRIENSVHGERIFTRIRRVRIVQGPNA